MASGPRSLTAFLAATALTVSSTAAGAAPTVEAAASISPWTALSIFGTDSSRASLCAAAVAAQGAAVAAQAPQQGCVLPVVDQAPPVADVPPPPPPVVTAGGGLPLGPLLVILGGLALFGLSLLDDEEDADVEDFPVSP